MVIMSVKKRWLYPSSRGPFLNYLGWNKPCLLSRSLLKLHWDRPLVTQASNLISRMWESVQNLNWVADWLHPCQQGINDVTANLIVSIEELKCMRLKTGFDVNNKQFGETILSCFRSAAQQSLAKLWNMQTSDNWIKVGWGRSFVWIYPTKGRTLNECDDFLLCFVMLELFRHCCLHKVEFSQIVPWVPGFFFFLS